MSEEAQAKILAAGHLRDNKAGDKAFATVLLLDGGVFVHLVLLEGYAVFTAVEDQTVCERVKHAVVDIMETGKAQSIKRRNKTRHV